MAAYLTKVKDLQRGFTSFNMTKVPRKNNERVDALERLASARPRNLPQATNVQVLQQPNIQRWAETKSIEYKESWMDLLIKYLTKDEVPKNALEVKRLRVRVASFTIIDGQLYK